ncbi:MAG: DUF2637 domain-containing protein [Microbacterium ginsengisoli]|nr:DUF2637 domain-containing protein [Microbacterium ginsengisoli]
MRTPAAPRTARPADAGVAGPGSGVPRLVIASSVTGTLVLALGAFWLSFTTLQDLAIMAGIPVGQAWVWPLIVDGVILEATISVVALRNQAPAARHYAWLLLASGAGVSVAANITHAIVAADARVPAVVAALVASVPPLVLLAMTHLTVELTRNAAPTRSDATPPAREDERAERTRPVSAGRERARGDRKTREQAARLAADGISKRQIAAQLGKHPTTIGRWLAVPDEDTEGDPS